MLNMISLLDSAYTNIRSYQLRRVRLCALVAIVCDAVSRRGQCNDGHFKGAQDLWRWYQQGVCYRRNLQHVQGSTTH